VPIAGQVLFHKSFVYANQSVGKKLVIALNTVDNEDMCLVLKTTSQSKYYNGTHPGCNSAKKCFSIYVECEQAGFNKPTFVQLDNIYPIDVAQLLDEKSLSFVGQLSDACFNNLRRCLRKFRDDIPDLFWEMIFVPYRGTKAN